MTIESVAENTAKNGAGAAAQRGPRPGGPKPGEPGGTTTNSPVPSRHPRRPQPAEGRRPEVRGPVPNGSRGQGQEQGQGQAQGQGGPGGRGQSQGQTPGQRPRQDPRGERALYDGGSPSANRLGPAKAMRARDVSRPRD